MLTNNNSAEEPIVDESLPSERGYQPHTRVLGVRLSLLNMPTAVAQIMHWVANKKSQFVCIRDVHGIMYAKKDQEFFAIHDQAGMVTPDGMPLVWLSRLRGAKTVNRVCGSDLVDAICRASLARGVRHFFYGGKPGVAERMASNLTARYPGLQVAGTYCPPFRPFSKEEDEAVVETISTTNPSIVWVGLSTPKQEFWMRDHVGRIPGATLIGVGAAFDFQAGTVKRSPQWMQRSGLEWLHRLSSEPRRLWRRYLISAPNFVICVLSEKVARHFSFKPQR